MSRYLDDLELAELRATDPIKRDVIRAEKASYLARQGRHEESSRITESLREIYKESPNIRVSVHLSIAEGLNEYYRDLGVLARDKIMRAKALSAAAGQNDLHALASAWLAQMEYARLDIEGVCRFCDDALRLASVEDHPTITRVALVIAHALHVAGGFGLAQHWYRLSHRHATHLGDDSTLSALIYNMATARIENLRQERLSGHLFEGGEGLAITATASAEAFDQMIGASSLEGLYPFLRARLYALTGNYFEALRIYEESVPPLLDSILRRLKCEILSDMALCSVMLGKHAEADNLARQSLESILPETQVDDVAATHSRLAKVCQALGATEREVKHQECASSAWSEYRDQQIAVVTKLHRLSTAHERFF